MALLCSSQQSTNSQNERKKENISLQLVKQTLELKNPLSLLINEERQKLLSEFSTDGFAVFPHVLSSQSVEILNERLEHVLRGNYDRNQRPDKAPKKVKLNLPPRTSSSPVTSAASLEGTNDKPTQFHTQRQGSCGQEQNKHQNQNSKLEGRNTRTKYRSAAAGPLGYSGNKQKKVLQIINIHKSDSMFRELVTSPILGELVATIMGWKDGARLAQDQVWAKPAGAPPLAYHRDSPYFMFTPSSLATVWIALDNMTEDVGPLTYVCSSHKWGDGRIGSTQHFFQEQGGKSLVHSAAERAGFSPKELRYVSLAGLEAGGLSIHDGRTWHGSGENLSNPHRARRGIGLHFVPVDVRWTEEAKHSKLWNGYVKEAMERGEDVTKLELDEDDFPITWKANT